MSDESGEWHSACHLTTFYSSHITHYSSLSMARSVRYEWQVGQSRIRGHRYDIQINNRNGLRKHRRPVFTATRARLRTCKTVTSAVAGCESLVETFLRDGLKEKTRWRKQ